MVNLHYSGYKAPKVALREGLGRCIKSGDSVILGVGEGFGEEEVGMGWKGAEILLARRCCKGYS
jgi:hypothetical protein